MVASRRSSDLPPHTTSFPSPITPSAPNPIAPVIKRRRRTSCLGEQERRERKRAIDREAQRSLREKTKTHIAELERTIEILRDQDREGTTKSLLGEIEGLRQENDRLREIIENVKSIVGLGIGVKAQATTTVQRHPTAPVSDGPSDAGTAAPRTSLKPHALPSTSTINSKIQENSSPHLHTPQPAIPEEFPSHHSTSPLHNHHQHHQPSHYTPISYTCHLASTSTIDLNGMTVLSGPISPDSSLEMDLDLSGPSDHAVSEHDSHSPLEAPDSPATAAFAPYIAEMFGPTWRCPSPMALNYGVEGDGKEGREEKRAGWRCNTEFGLKVSETCRRSLALPSVEDRQGFGNMKLKRESVRC
ncbi:hypothetical protein GQ43DRAFT_66519 [Delitschia confertaspora ATCC 74209]|uniref:BZIP domain-containing protein n=1 Tax=Delitschia confertaspora ATCC 74209 TaxID=1513339 RepID=A0A9P4JTL6_9PLEO|nr:hypothetical protein GQ43DRAFT_66519 [Delitschia confertaspora ATCC 74209]